MRNVSLWLTPMSLKAKIEAVIYASEEPVTLAQLVGLLGQEAQAELDQANSAQASLSLNETEADLEAAAEQDPTLSDSDGAAGGEEMVVSQPPESVSEPSSAEANVAADDQTSASDQPDTAGLARIERARVAKLRIYFRSILDSLVTEYATADRGLEIREVAGGYRFATKPEYHDAVRGFVRSLKPPLKLSLQALETLAVVAYKQPVTAPEVSEIRGVDSGGVLGSLMVRKLVTTAGRKQVIGRPILYKTTKEFLLKFGLKDLGELPSIEEFERLAGQMAEQEEIPMQETSHHEETEADTDGQEEIAPETDSESASERDDYAPQPPAIEAPADNLSGESADKASIDGRISSLPPDYDGAEAADDPSAREAEIQAGEGS